MVGHDMIQEVAISPLGWAVIICPDCGGKNHATPSQESQHRVLNITCRCGAKHQIVFNTRSKQRKDCSLPGILLLKNNITVEIKNISQTGAYFEGNELNLYVGSTYPLKVRIDEQWIEVLVQVVRANEKSAGIEFVNLGYNESKMIESFVLSA
jgi:hypothetical protein